MILSATWEPRFMVINMFHITAKFKLKRYRTSGVMIQVYDLLAFGANTKASEISKGALKVWTLPT